VYARGERAGQPKPTPPTLQAKHWLAEALLAALLAGDGNVYTEIAIAFPHMPRRDLIGKIQYAIDRLGLQVFFVDEGGHVTVLSRATV
jgi:hypothetical protein